MGDGCSFHRPSERAARNSVAVGYLNIRIRSKGIICPVLIWCVSNVRRKRKNYESSHRHTLQELYRHKVTLWQRCELALNVQDGSGNGILPSAVPTRVQTSTSMWYFRSVYTSIDVISMPVTLSNFLTSKMLPHAPDPPAIVVINTCLGAGVGLIDGNGVG